MTGSYLTPQCSGDCVFTFADLIEGPFNASSSNPSSTLVARSRAFGASSILHFSQMRLFTFASLPKTFQILLALMRPCRNFRYGKQSFARFWTALWRVSEQWFQHVCPTFMATTKSKIDRSPRSLSVSWCSWHQCISWGMFSLFTGHTWSFWKHWAAHEAKMHSRNYGVRQHVIDKLYLKQFNCYKLFN